MPGTLAVIDAPLLLLVCTANQCRSPMAEGLLRHMLDGRGIQADVRSAGLMDGGAPGTGHTLGVLQARGIDLGSHVSRTLDADAVAAADLVIGMERRHIQRAVALVREAEAWSFTLRDLVARADASPVRGPDEAVRAWATRLAAGRPHSAILGIGDDGIADPIGGPRHEYERTAVELDSLLSRLVDRAFASVVVP